MSYAYRPQARPHGMTLAGLGPRLVARLIDIFAVLLLNVLANGWFAYQWLQDFAPIVRAAIQDPLATPPQPSARLSYLTWGILLVATAVWLAYEVPALGNSGQTLGKRIMKIRVVRTESLEPVGLGRAFLRWGRLGLWLPLWACWGLGLLMQLIDSLSPVFDQKLRQALHDKTARTVVVQATPLPVTAGRDPATRDRTDQDRTGTTDDTGGNP
jgi:uncharacterized RDD family membrane protein YckC